MALSFGLLRALSEQAELSGGIVQEDLRGQPSLRANEGILSKGSSWENVGFLLKGSFKGDIMPCTGSIKPLNVAVSIDWGSFQRALGADIRQV